MTRQTAGMHVVVSTLLAWSAGNAQNVKPSPTVHVSSAPEWTLDLRRDFPSERIYIAGAALTKDRIVVVDRASPRLLIYSRDKKLVRAIPLKSGRQSRANPHTIQRVAGDSLAILGDAEGWIVHPRDSIATQISFARPKPDRPPTPVMMLAALADGSSLWGALDLERQLHPLGKVFVDSLDIIVQSPSRETRTIRKVPALMLGTDSAGQSRQMWFYPHMAFAGSGDAFYYGYGGDYTISKLTPSTGAETSFKRAWTRRKVTAADIDEFINGWSLNWNNGPDSLAQKASMHKHPFAEFVPAFSQFLLSSSNDLWVRNANLVDAQGAGELNQVPLGASTWSVFDNSGIWISDVSLPAGFQPTDIGSDYILGVQYVVKRSTVGSERSIVMYKYSKR